MAVNIREGALSWEASVDTSKARKDVDDLVKDLVSTSKQASTTVDEFARKTAGGVNKLSQSVETLRAKILAREDFILKETDLNRIAQYNQEIESLKLQINQILNAGKTGFDKLGNPIAKFSNTAKKGFQEIGKETEVLAKKTNILSKAYSFFRQAAFLIPGLGIAGIFNIIGEGVGRLFNKIFQTTASIKTFSQISNTIQEEAIKGYSKEVTTLELLKKIITSKTATIKERNTALANYNEIADKANKIDKASIDNSNLIESAIARQIELLKQRALARAAESVIAEKAEALFLAEQKARVKEEERFVADVGAGQIIIAERYDAITGTYIKNNEEILEADRQRIISGRVAADESVKNAKKELDASLLAGAPFVQGGQTDPKVDKQKKSNADLNALLGKRKSLLESIRDLERDAFQSGLTKEASEIDKVNERREKELRLVEDLNTAIDVYNKKHKTKIDEIGKNVTDRINQAANILIQNNIYKQDAEKYLESISQKQKAFEAFQQAQETGSILITEQVRQTYQNDIGEFNSFIDLLKSEYDRLFDTLNFDNTDDVGTVAKFKGIAEMLEKATSAANDDEKKRLQENFSTLLKETDAFNLNKFKINEKYNKLEEALLLNKGLLSIESFNEQQDVIKTQREKELNDLKDEFALMLPAFENFFKGLEGLSDTASRKIVQDARNILAKLISEGKISDDLVRRLNKELNEADHKISSRLPGELSKISSQFKSLADEAGSFNSELGTILSTLGSMVGLVGQVKQGIADFKLAKGNDDVLGQIGSVIGIAGPVLGVINAIGSIFKKQREERRRQQKEVSDFLNAQFIGEQEINLLYQERARQQVLINKLRVDGLKDEKKLLIQQKNEVLVNYQTVFDELQKQTFKAKATIQTIFGPKDFLVDHSLFGKTFDELEQLFLKGQLEGKAKDLFQELQKIKESGVDIDRLLEENKKAAQELFTGTTAQNISNTIRQGLQDGKRSLEDFAGDFESLMQEAILNSLEFKALEGPLNKFLEDFAAAAESDNQLTSAEIDRLQGIYNGIIDNAASQFDQLQQIAGLNLASANNREGSLSGAIKGITEQQADLLAGQFGGLRLSVIEQTKVAMQGVKFLQNIEINTAVLHRVLELMRRAELNGIKVNF